MAAKRKIAPVEGKSIQFDGKIYKPGESLMIDGKEADRLIEIGVAVPAAIATQPSMTVEQEE